MWTVVWITFSVSATLTAQLRLVSLKHTVYCLIISLSYFAYGDICPSAEHITQWFSLLQPRLLQTYSIWLQQQADWITRGTDSNTYSKHRATGELPVGNERAERTPTTQCTPRATRSARLNTRELSTKRHYASKTITIRLQKSSSSVSFPISHVSYSPEE